MYPYDFLSVPEEELEDFCSENGFNYREMEMLEAIRSLHKRIEVLEEKLAEKKE